MGAFSHPGRATRNPFHRRDLDEEISPEAKRVRHSAESGKESCSGSSQLTISILDSSFPSPSLSLYLFNTLR